jgi:Zn-dependent alcohol dehydrogenases
MDWFSDLHTYRGIEPSPPGPIMGHEFMGEIVEVGSDVTALQKGDRVVSAFYYFLVFPPVNGFRYHAFYF